MVGYLSKRLKAFGYAFNGIALLFKESAHAKIHALAIIVVTAAGLYLNIDWQDWRPLLLCFILVLGLEALNSALEYSLDLLHPEQHPLVKKAKDTAAGAVLIAAIGSIIMAILVFKPYLMA